MLDEKTMCTGGVSAETLFSDLTAFFSSLLAQSSATQLLIVAAIATLVVAIPRFTRR